MFAYIVNFVLFQVGWFAAILLAASGRPSLAALSVVAVLAVHLLVIENRALEMKFLLPAIPFGFGFDSLFAATGALEFVGQPGPYVCPPWTVSLWVLFAATFRHSSRWIAGRPYVSALLGATVAPMSYAAGRRFGAIEFGEPFTRSVAIVGACWAVAMYASSKYASRLLAPAVDDAAEPAA